jgi:hypothetical protein
MSARLNNAIFETMTAGADLTATQYHILRLSAADTVTLATSVGHVDIVGVQHTKANSGNEITCVLGGMTPLVCGSSIAVNTYFTVSASGRAITAAPASGAAVFVVGRVLEAPSADGDIVTAWVQQPFRYYSNG